MPRVTVDRSLSSSMFNVLVVRFMFSNVICLDRFVKKKGKLFFGSRKNGASDQSPCVTESVYRLVAESKDARSLSCL